MTYPKRDLRTRAPRCPLRGLLSIMRHEPASSPVYPYHFGVLRRSPAIRSPAGPHRRPTVEIRLQFGIKGPLVGCRRWCRDKKQHPKSPELEPQLSLAKRSGATIYGCAWARPPPLPHRRNWGPRGAQECSPLGAKISSRALQRTHNYCTSTQPPTIRLTRYVFTKKREGRRWRHRGKANKKNRRCISTHALQPSTAALPVRASQLRGVTLVCHHFCTERL